MALGVYVIISGFKLGFGDWHEPGSGFIAVLSGSLLLVLSMLWLVMTFLKKGSLEASRKFFKKSGSYKKVSLTVFALAAYALLIKPLGFLLSTLLLMVFLLKAIEPQRWKLTLIMAITVTVLCVIIFQIWLQVQFPEGLLGIYRLKKWTF